jgi:hypothetical protein
MDSRAKEIKGEGSELITEFLKKLSEAMKN